MSFAAPLWLLALLLIPVLAGLYLFAQRRRSRYAVRFTNLNLLANVAATRPAWRRHVPPALFLAGLGILALAVARPETDVKVPKEEATVVMVFDVSGSMNAEDVEPTRLIAAQEAANAFLDRIPEKFRVGMVSFSESARVVLPPTDDRELARDAVARLRAEGGTAMGDAILLALESIREPAAFGALPDGQQAPGSSEGAPAAPPAVILLLSDGTSTTGASDPISAAELAAEQGVPVFTVALGTAEGYVDIVDDTGVLRRIPVPPDEATLDLIAEMTGGEFFEAASDEQLTGVYESLGSKVGFDTEKREVTWAFAGIAGLLLLAGVAASLYWFNRFP